MRFERRTDALPGRQRPRAPELRAVWFAVAVVGLLLAAILLFELARPRDFLTGTNSAGSDGPVVHVEPGHQLCVDALEVPGGTGRLRLRLGPVGATPVAAEATAGGRLLLARVAVAARSGAPRSAPATLDVPVDARRDTTGRLCVTPAGVIDVVGRPGLEPGQRPALVDGKPVNARVAVWYLPPAGERKSLLTQMPAMFGRAAHFRPGIVGPWTYAVLLFVLTPAVFAAGMILFVRAVLDRPVRRTALAIGAIGFLAAASWSLIIPAFDAPDEAEHMAYAQAIAERGRAPDTGPTRTRAYSSEAEVAYQSAHLSGYFGQRLGRPPWTGADERRWERRQAQQRPPPDDGGGWVTVADYVPLYYGALAPAYLAAKGQSVWSRFAAMRLVSALFGGLAAAFVFLLVAELLPRPRWPAVAAGLFVAFQPMFAFISGVINNDAGVNAFAAIGLYLVVRALRRRLTIRLAVALGATIVLLPLMKGNGLFLLPPIASGLAVAAFRTRRAGGALKRPLIALGVTLVATAALAVAFSAALGHSADPTRPGWYTAIGNTYPSLPGADVRPSGALSHPVQFAQYVWQVFLPPVAGMPDLRPGGGRLPPGYIAYVERGWASFGFVTISFPKWVYAVIVLVILALVVLALVAWARHRAAVSHRRWELAVLVLAVLGVFVGTEIAYFAPGDPSVPEFGRYLFPAAGAIAGIAALATFGLGRRLAPLVAASLLTAMMGLFWASEFLTMSALYN
jgi:hypothetical protein